MISGLLSLLALILGALGSLTIPIIIAIVIIVIVRNDNKRRAANAEARRAQALTDVNSGNNTTGVITSKTPAAPPKKKNPYTMLNVLLICGSFLLVAAMISFMENTNNALVAPTAIILTLLFYGIGYAIYHFVDYLKPVGLCFGYTATAVFPFWVISFTTLGLPDQTAWILVSAITLAMLIVTSILFKSKITPFFAYLWMLVLAVSCTPFENNTASLWWAFASTSALSLIPLLVYKAKPTWLPVYFRKATQISSYVLFPYIFINSLTLYIIPDIATIAPFLRSAMAVFAIAYTLLAWSRQHQYGWFITSRFAVQALLLACIADALNFSLFDDFLTYNYGAKSVSLGALSITIVWAVSFLIQALIALFIPKKNQTIKAAEHLVEILSLIGIFITPIFTLSFDSHTAAIVQLVVYSIIAILGVAYSVIHKNILWSIATLGSLLLIPIAVSEGLEVAWSGWINIIYFTIYGALVLLGLKLVYKNQPNSFPLAICGLIVSSLILLISALDVGYAEIAWLIITMYLMALGYITGYKVIYELGIYSGAFCVFSLIGTIGETIFGATSPVKAVPRCTGAYDYSARCLETDYNYDAYYNAHQNLVLLLDTIRSFIMPAALIGVSIWKERKLPANQKWRFFVGYAMLSLSLLIVGWRGDGYWMLTSLITQVGFLVYAVLKDQGWLVWTSIVALLWSALSLTGGFTYIWFGTIGIILIMIVIWRLTKLNKANKLHAENKKKE